MYAMSTLYTISEKGTPISYGFSSIWISFLAVSIGMYGVQVLREKMMRSQYHIGIFIGISGTMSITMLIELIFTAADVAHAKLKGEEHAGLTKSEIWSVVFSSLCIIGYSFFAWWLYKDRAAIILFHEDIHEKQIFSISKDPAQFTQKASPTDRLNKGLSLN